VLCLHAWACILQAQLSLLHADHCVLVCNDTWQVTTSAGPAYGCPCSTSASAHIAERFCHHQVVSHTVKTSLQSAAHPRAKPTEAKEHTHVYVAVQGFALSSKSEQRDSNAISLGGRHPTCLLTPPQAQVSHQASTSVTPSKTNLHPDVGILVMLLCCCHSTECAWSTDDCSLATTRAKASPCLLPTAVPFLHLPVPEPTPLGVSDNLLPWLMFLQDGSPRSTRHSGTPYSCCFRSTQQRPHHPHHLGRHSPAQQQQPTARQTVGARRQQRCWVVDQQPQLLMACRMKVARREDRLARICTVWQMQLLICGAKWMQQLGSPSGHQGKPSWAHVVLCCGGFGL
jgi:hypothetical protein